MHSKDADGMTNNAYPDQTGPLGAVREQSDLGMHCFRVLASNLYIKFEINITHCGKKE